MGSDTLSDFDIPVPEITAALEPWVVRRHGSGDLAWRVLRANKWAAYGKRRLLRPAASAAERQRRPTFVADHYDETWSRYVWPDPDEPPDRRNMVYLEWRRLGYATLRHGLVRCHLLGVARAIERLRPRTVLEVGAGPGMNLAALAGMFPEISFSGAELTASGVAALRSIQSEPLPTAFDQFAPLPIRDRDGHRRIEITQADARELPFGDGGFDLVFTRLALEQMENVRAAAFAEIHRVAGSHAVFVEPFVDFQRTSLQALAVRSKNYLSLGVDKLLRHGFTPCARFDDWPQKITNGAGLVICRKAGL